MSGRLETIPREILSSPKLLMVIDTHQNRVCLVGRGGEQFTGSLSSPSTSCFAQAAPGSRVLSTTITPPSWIREFTVRGVPPNCNFPGLLFLAQSSQFCFVLGTAWARNYRHHDLTAAIQRPNVPPNTRITGVGSPSYTIRFLFT